MRPALPIDIIIAIIRKFADIHVTRREWLSFRLVSSMSFQTLLGQRQKLISEFRRAVQSRNTRYYLRYQAYNGLFRKRTIYAPQSNIGI